MGVERGGKMIARKETRRVAKLPDRSPRGDGTPSGVGRGSTGVLRRVTTSFLFGRVSELALPLTVDHAQPGLGHLGLERVLNPESCASSKREKATVPSLEGQALCQVVRSFRVVARGRGVFEDFHAIQAPDGKLRESG